MLDLGPGAVMSLKSSLAYAGAADPRWQRERGGMSLRSWAAPKHLPLPSGRCSQLRWPFMVAASGFPLKCFLGYWPP
jgi:hypothetical protein